MNIFLILWVLIATNDPKNPYKVVRYRPHLDKGWMKCTDNRKWQCEDVAEALNQAHRLRMCQPMCFWKESGCVCP